jgi:hypothetical protein
MSTLQLQSEIEKLPSNLQKEVEDFIEFLLEKEKKKQDSSQKKERLAGTMKGLIIMSDDFDEPLDDFKEYME